MNKILVTLFLSLLFSACVHVSQKAKHVTKLEGLASSDTCVYLGTKKQDTTSIGFSSAAQKQLLNLAADRSATHVRITHVQNGPYFGTATGDFYRCAGRVSSDRNSNRKTGAGSAPNSLR